MDISQQATPRGFGLLRLTIVATALGACTLLAGGCRTTAVDRDYDPVIAQFFLETAAADPTGRTVELPVSGVVIPVAPRVQFSEGDIVAVELVRVDLGLCLLFVFDEDSARSLFRLSAANLGRRLVVTLNGRAFGARTFEAPIGDGRLFVFVELSDEELAATATSLKKTTADIRAAIDRRKGR
ncbi:hypothetical protein [Congregicoccus parvus]|uniref:hypothetical protein n=1 Tax=Congregicoccus parvus TaxID=3081749 RepID=UPI003FA59017